jgi:acetolactate synthase-1/2/3 large subunit
VALRALRAADLVLVIGSDLDQLATTEFSWPAPDAQLVRVDIDPAELLALPGLNLWGDARHVLAELNALGVPDTAVEREAWIGETCELAQAMRPGVRAGDLKRQGSDSVWPGAMMQVVTDELGPADIVVADASYSSGWALDRVTLDSAGRRVLAPRGTGMLGWGVPAGIGAALACPDANVTVLVGDGAFQYSLGDLETAAAAELDLTVVLINNGIYGSQRLSNLLMQDRDYDDLHFGAGADYAALARSTGWNAVRVDELGDFRDAHRSARVTGGCWLVEVIVDRDMRPPLVKFDPR